MACLLRGGGLFHDGVAFDFEGDLSVDEGYPPPFFSECGVGESDALSAVAFNGAVSGFFCAGIAQGDKADDVRGVLSCDSLVSVGGVALDVVEVYVFCGEDGDVQQASGAGAEESCGKEKECELFHGFLWAWVIFCRRGRLLRHTIHAHRCKGCTTSRILLLRWRDLRRLSRFARWLCRVLLCSLLYLCG